ncbi:MAG: dihydroorotate dehydrogenase electron transfer subunit [Nitrospira sp.]|nr:dihydroorotate dehydrogenase electron transfer subunit [bacterium]MBL7049340.1 dihydroorotate dehydrogenase electron transfer subunit [Nitrospira sp.]
MKYVLNKIIKAKIQDNRKIIDRHYLLTLEPSTAITTPKPGQFYMLSVNNGLDPLLKRPLSVHNFLDGKLQFLYRVVGKGTDLLSSRVTGESIDILGPLGNGFTVSKTKQIILLAGGLGIAPIYYLAASIAGRKPVLIYGAGTKETLIYRDQIKNLGIETVIATDDGSYGKKGNVVTVLKKYLKDTSLPYTDHIIYTCGSEAMLKPLAEFASEHGIKIHAAMEQNMACGVGTCMGCVVKTRKGLKRVCKEGPVFNLNEIEWE